MTKYKLIVNPTSGRGFGLKAVPSIKQLLTTSQIDYSVVLTQRPGHAIELAQQAAEESYDCVVSVGGDGAANEVLNGLMLAKKILGKSPAMGILGVGRGNDFAYGANIPPGVEAGCQVIVQNHRRWMDVGCVTGGNYPLGRYFGNGIGIGFDAVVGFEAVKITWLSGFPSYIVATLKTIFLYFRAPLIKIGIDQQSSELSPLMVSIMNGRRMGGGFMMAPDAKNDDGLLNLCIANQVSRGRIFTLIPHFMRGTQATQKEIRMLSAKKVIVEALKGSLPAHADGETLCTEGQRLDVEILPKQIEMICLP